MSLPTKYLTTTKNLGAILDAIKNAQAPDKFSQTFLEGLGFKSSSDRLVIGILKSLGFIDDSGKPLTRYFEFLDQTQSGRVLAEATREAYSDLFQVNKNAQNMQKTDIKNKLKTLSQGSLTEAVLDDLAATFLALVKLADWAALEKPVDPEKDKPPLHDDKSAKRDFGGSKPFAGDLVYNIQIHLPESRDAAVYDVLFRSLKEHLL